MQYYGLTRFISWLSDLQSNFAGSRRNYDLGERLTWAYY